MEKRETIIINHLGLHARAAAKLVTLCSKYRSRVVLFSNCFASPATNYRNFA